MVGQLLSEGHVLEEREKRETIRLPVMGDGQLCGHRLTESSTPRVSWTGFWLSPSGLLPTS